ncbi:MAG TPA: hypothetical protein VFA83_21955, partial [Acidimicrobiales bacterium]|nr:hypothetical protein [Acidimicrobiales bacterium]
MAAVAEGSRTSVQVQLGRVDGTVAEGLPAGDDPGGVGVGNSLCRDLVGRQVIGLSLGKGRGETLEEGAIPIVHYPLSMPVRSGQRIAHQGVQIAGQNEADGGGGG